MQFEVTESLFLYALQTSKEHKTDKITIEKIQKQEFPNACIGLLCDIEYYKVDYNNGKATYSKDLVVKIPYRKPCYESALRRGYYDSELLLYTSILPEFNQLLGTDTELTPKTYKCSKRYVTILENLSAQGYHNLEKFEQLDLKQALAAIELLAKFHAVSYKLNQIKPDLLTVFKRKIKMTQVVTMELFRSLDSLMNVIENNEQMKPFADYMNRVVENIAHDPMLVCRYSDDNLCVLNHGDYWMNNILLKKEENQWKAKMIDLQCCRWISPVFDIIKFVVCSVKEEIFEAHSEEIFQTYVDEFNRVMKFLNCDLFYTLEQLHIDLHFNRYNYLPIISVYLRTFFAEPDHVTATGSSIDVINLEPLFANDTYPEIKYKECLAKWLAYIKKTDLFEIHYPVID